MEAIFKGYKLDGITTLYITHCVIQVSYPRSDHPGDFAATRVSLQEKQASFTEKS